MFVENLCPPAILYLGFSLTQIIIDLFRKMYNTAMIKIAITVVFTTVLNMLCKSGLSMISWFIVFIPFVTMTLVTGMLLYMFGLGPFTGKMDYSKINGEEKNPAVDRGLGPQEPAPAPAPAPIPTPAPEVVKPLPGPRPETNPDLVPQPDKQPNEKQPSLASTFMVKGKINGTQKPNSVSGTTKKPTFESSLTENATPVDNMLKTVITDTTNVQFKDFTTNKLHEKNFVDTDTTIATTTYF